MFVDIGPYCEVREDCGGLGLVWHVPAAGTLYSSSILCTPYDPGALCLCTVDYCIGQLYFAVMFSVLLVLIVYEQVLLKCDNNVDVSVTFGTTV